MEVTSSYLYGFPYWMSSGRCWTLTFISTGCWEPFFGDFYGTPGNILSGSSFHPLLFQCGFNRNLQQTCLNQRIMKNKYFVLVIWVWLCCCDIQHLKPLWFKTINLIYQHFWAQLWVRDTLQSCLPCAGSAFWKLLSDASMSANTSTITGGKESWRPLLLFSFQCIPSEMTHIHISLT